VLVFLTGGGTGGHLYPALAIGETLEKMSDCRITYIGTAYGLESKIIPGTHYGFNKVWIRGLKRGAILGNFLFPIRMLVSLIQCAGLILRHGPDMIVGTGGYVSWPVLTAGVLLRKKTFLHEQNQKPGLVTKVLAPKMSRVYLSFQQSQKFLRRKDNTLFTGNPTRAAIRQASKKEGYERFQLNPKKVTVFIFGGSQGALGINQIITHHLSDLMNTGNIQLLWITGPRWFDSVLQKIKTCQDRLCVLPFLEEMHLAYAISDLVISRSGATTIAELTQLGLPAFFIPFPHAAGGHQEENARILVQAGAAEMMTEQEIRDEPFVEKIRSLIENKKRRIEMGHLMRSFAKPDAAACIAEDMIKTVNQA